MNMHAMNKHAVHQHEAALSTLTAVWEKVKESKRQAIILLEAPGGTKKTEVVLTFLKDGQVPHVFSRGTEVPSPYLPFHTAYQSIFNLDVVRKSLETSDPNELPLEEQRLLSAVISSTHLLQPTAIPNAARTHKWRLSHYSAFKQEPGPDSDAQDTYFMPITLPNQLAATLNELANFSPITIFLDDTDLLDSSSLEALLREVLPALQSVPILFIFTFGSVSLDVDNPFSQFLDDLKNKYDPTHIQLSLLSQELVKQIVTTEFSNWERQPSEALISDMFLATSGNLAQLQDLLDWLEHNYLDKNQAIPAKIPTHDSLVNDQFLQLSSYEQTILHYASCQGRYFCVEVVAKTLDSEVGAILEHLIEIGCKTSWVKADTQLSLMERPVHWYRFRSRKQYERIYNAVPTERLTVYHRQVGEALEYVYRDLTQDIADLLAYQFDKSQQYVKAAEYLAILANQANRQGDIISAVEYADRGLAHLERNGRKQKLEDYLLLEARLLIEKGKAYLWGEKAHTAPEILRKAIETLRRVKQSSHDKGLLNKDLLLIDANYYLGKAQLNSNRWDEGVDILYQAVNQTIEIQDWLRTAEILESLRFACAKRGDVAFIDKCDRAVEKLKNEDSPLATVAIAEILEDKGWFHLERRDFESASDCFSEGFSTLANLQNREQYPEIFYKLHYRQANTLRFKRDWTRALENAQNTVELSASRRKAQTDFPSLNSTA
jgi:tetratricopeptide (TPR) repeat protein